MNKLLKKFQSLSVTLKATIVFGIASFAISGINYITTPVFTRILTTDEYGIIAGYNAWYSIVQVFATMTLIFPGILQVGLYEYSKNRWKYLSTMLGIITVSTGVLGVLYFCFRESVNALFQLPTNLVVLMLLTCLLQPATTLWTMKQRYEYRYKITFFVTVGSAVIAQIVSIAAVLYAKNHWDTNLASVRLWSAGAVNLAVAVVLFIYLLSKGQAFVDGAVWKATFIVAIPLIPHYLSSVVLSSTDKIMIRHMVSNSKAGIYTLAATLSSLGVLFWRALSTTFSPFVNTKLGERKFQDIDRCIRPLMSMVGLTCFLGALAAPEIIRILAVKEYLEGVYVVPPIVIGIFLHALYDIFSAVSFFHKKSVYIMMASVTAALANIVLNYFCIKRFGYIAAGYTTLASNLILTGMHYINMRRIEKERIYDPLFIIKAVALVTVGCLACNFLYGITSIVRYVLIAAVLVVIVMRRKSVTTALSDMKV